MLRAETKFRKLKEAKEKGHIDKDGNILIVDKRGIPHSCKPTFLMKIFAALDKFMYRQ